MGVVALTDIQDFVANLAREFLPEKVILFGSYAAGNARAESDIDLLVVMPEECQSMPITAPKDWNQKGWARRRSNSSRP